MLRVIVHATFVMELPQVSCAESTSWNMNHNSTIQESRNGAPKRTTYGIAMSQPVALRAEGNVPHASVWLVKKKYRLPSPHESELKIVMWNAGSRKPGLALRCGCWSDKGESLVVMRIPHGSIRYGPS